MSVFLELPWPPSANSYRQPLRSGKGMYVTAAGKRFFDLVARRVAIQGRPAFGSRRLSVHIVAYAPDRRARDLDNHLKALLDALEKAGVYDNDSQIDRILIERGPVRGTPGGVDVVIDSIGVTEGGTEGGTSDGEEANEG